MVEIKEGDRVRVGFTRSGTEPGTAKCISVAGYITVDTDRGARMVFNKKGSLLGSLRLPGGGAVGPFVWSEQEFVNA